MPSTPIAYNPSLAAISGTQQVGELAVGTSAQAYSTKPGGVTWWMSPDTASGYVISAPRAGQPNQTADTGTVRFWRSKLKTDASFLELVNKLSKKFGGGVLADVTAASAWLTSNGYWTTWVQPYVAGLYKTTYAGYFADNVNFFATATPQAFGTNPITSVQTTSIFEPATDDGTQFSCQWLGYFKPTTSETYTFFTSSDDASYVWVGSNAQTGFTTTNSTVNNGGLHGNTEKSGSIALTAGVYYPIRIQFGEQGGGDVLTFNYSTPTITKTTNVTGLVFYNSTTNGF